MCLKATSATKHQNVPLKAQVKFIFVLWKSYDALLRYSSFCVFNHPMIQ